MDQIFETADILILVFVCIDIFLQIFLHIQTHATDCRGQLVSKTKSADGQTCTREAKLSIHEASPPTELLQFEKT